VIDAIAVSPQSSLLHDMQPLGLVKWVTESTLPAIGS
jgi:hypothetical protein